MTLSIFVIIIGLLAVIWWLKRVLCWSHEITYIQWVNGTYRIIAYPHIISSVNGNIYTLEYLVEKYIAPDNKWYKEFYQPVSFEEAKGYILEKRRLQHILKSSRENMPPRGTVVWQEVQGFKKGINDENN